MIESSSSGVGRLPGSARRAPSKSCSQPWGASFMIGAFARRPAAPVGVSAMRTMALLPLILLTAAAAPSQSVATAPVAALDARVAAGFAALALKCLHTEYPSHISHSMSSDSDSRPPHLLTPAFHRCYDWHSDVHGHWLLLRP